MAEFLGNAGLWLPGLAFGLTGAVCLAHHLPGIGVILVAMGGPSTWLYRRFA